MSARSTAGVALACECGRPSTLPWINAAADAYRGPRLALAVQVGRAARVVDGRLVCSVGVAELARRAGQERHDAGVHLAALVADGFLEDGPRGRGSARCRTSYALVGLALFRRDEVPEYGAPGRPTPVEYGAPGRPTPAASPLVGVVTTTTGGRGGGEPFGQAPRDPALAEVLAGLPPALLPRDDAQEAETGALVAGYVAAGWTPAGIVAAARAGLRPGPVAHPPKMLRLLVPPRPVTELRRGPVEPPAAGGPMCPVHAFQDASSCRGCAADRKAAGGAS